jgi:S1 RNA binding domain protein
MQIEIGSIVEGKVKTITKYGAFVELPNGETGLVHISEIVEGYVKEVSEHLSVSQEVKVKVLSINEGKINLSIKKANVVKRTKPPEQHFNKPMDDNKTSFEDKLSKFLQDSNEKMKDINKHNNPRKGNSYKKSLSSY